MIDSRALVNVGRPLRWLILSILILGLIAGMTLVVYYFWFARNLSEPRYNDAILLGFSLIQITATALVIALVGFYGESDATTMELKERTRRILESIAVESLRNVSVDPMLREEPTSVTYEGAIDVFGAAYTMRSGKDEIRLWIGLNVRRLIVIYWIEPGRDMSPEQSAERIKEAFRFTFQGASKVGWSTNYEAAEIDDNSIISMWSTVEASENLLTNPAERLFWTQDIAMMTESIWRTATRNGLKFSKVSPRPL